MIQWKKKYSLQKKRYIFSTPNDEFNLGSLPEESQNVHNTQRAQRALFFFSLVFVPWFHSSLKFLQMYFNLSDSQKCNIYSKHSSLPSLEAEITPSTKRGFQSYKEGSTYTFYVLRSTLDEEEEDDFLHPMRIECIYSRMRSL